MKNRIHMKISAALLGLILSGVATAAAAATCYNGYCPNASIPVVGGYVFYDPPPSSVCQSNPSKTGCQGFSGAVYPFGEVALKVAGSYPSVTAGAYIDYTAQCPANTAQIAVPNGYLANNGVTYNSITINGQVTQTTTYVCVQTDTN